MRGTANTNPFPGMNPYLEAFWAKVHVPLVVRACDQVNERLPEGFVAAPGPASIVGLPEDRCVRVFEVDGGRVVSVVHFLRPHDKSGRGAEAMEWRRHVLWESGINVLDVDLLRARDRRSVSRPAPDRGPDDDDGSTYRAVARWPSRAVGRVPSPAIVTWTFGLRERLPCVALQLGPHLPTCTLDLQSAMDHAWEHSRFERRIDYRVDPVPPLDPDDAGWVNGILRTAGLR
jgi:hypothetical protein